MMLPNDRQYYSESSSSPPHASIYPSQYLGATQLSNSTYDSDESQHRKSSITADQDPQWFSDFISYESDESTTEAEAMSVVKTSGSVTIDLKSGTSALPLLDMLLDSVAESIDAGVTDNTGLYRWLNSTEHDIKDPATGLDSTDNNIQWATKPVLGLFVSNHPENQLGTNSKHVLPSHPISGQIYTPNKVAVPQIHHHICHTCNRHCNSQRRLREHLRNFHQPPRFICSTCRRGFQYKKDIIRHDRTHGSSKPTFDCSCKKSYKRLDSLKRHIAAQMAEVPAETGYHKPV